VRRKLEMTIDLWDFSVYILDSYVHKSRRGNQKNPELAKKCHRLAWKFSLHKISSEITIYSAALLI
jgi:hypothetical protein